MHRLILAFACVFALSLGGCGNGGSNNEEDLVLPLRNTVESSSYWLGSLHAPLSGFAAHWAVVQPLGDERASISWNSNLDGTLMAFDLEEQLVVSEDGTMRLIEDAAADSEGRQGWIDAAGRFALLYRAQETDARISVLAKRPSPGFGPAQALGRYHMVSMHQDLQADRPVATWARATFATNNLITFDDLEVSGAGGTCIGQTSEPFVVEQDGALTLGEDTPMGALRGGFESAGDVAIVGGRAQAGMPPELAVFVRQSSAQSTASVAGTYRAVIMLREPSATTAIGATAVFDGVGTMELRYSRDGLPQQDTLTYEVDPATGRVAASMEGDPILGGVSPDGAFLAMSGIFKSGGIPMVMFLVRVSPSAP